MGRNWCATGTRSRKGLTLIEVLVSIGVALLFLGAAGTSLLNAQFLTSYSRHKIQAMYAAQQILEQQRRKAFTTVGSTTTGTVILDPASNFSGNYTLTVTNLSTYTNRAALEINWQEQVFKGKRTLREYYSTTIASDPVAN